LYKNDAGFTVIEKEVIFRQSHDSNKRDVKRFIVPDGRGAFFREYFFRE